MKRGNLPFDTRHFEKLKEQGKALNTEDTFREIFQSNHWSGDSSISGQGSDTNQTEEISIQIPKLIDELKIKRFLDVPCGDFNWFSKIETNLELYIGGDIIEEIIDRNNHQYASDKRAFRKIDLIKDPLPEADILLCRDCLVHLSNEHILQAIANIKASNINFLLTTTFPECDKNVNITTGDWRIINLQKPPFNLPQPERIINEKCTEADGTYADKSLALWRIVDL